MSFLTNMFTKWKVSTPESAPSCPPSTTNKPLSADWDLVSPEDIAGYHHDRITLILGPDEATHQLLLADIPTSSQLLARLSHLAPSQRCIRLPSLDVNMIDLYMQPHSVDALAHEFSWDEVIKLVITAEILQDAAVETTAIAALKKKCKAVEERLHVMYTFADYQLAKSHHVEMGGGTKLVQTLDDIADTVYAKTRMGRSAPASGYTGTSLNGDQMDRQGPGKYANSVLRDRGLTGPKADEAEEKECPVRQPTVPPSVEALRLGTVGNFV